MYIVYVLKSIIDGSHYCGFSQDVAKRVNEHNLGKNRSTSYKRPWKLIHAEMVLSRIEARKLEIFFKSGYGREIIKEIEAQLTTEYSPVAQR